MPIFLLALSTLPAQSAPLQDGRYACNGTAFVLQLVLVGTKGGMATLYSGGTILSNAAIAIADGTIAFTFSTGGDKYKGKTWMYKIESDAAFSGNGESWLRIGNGYYAPPTAPGGIANPLPAGDEAYKLKSGTYGLSGSRRQMVLVLSGRNYSNGSGHIKDDAGKPAGNFTARVDKNHLSLLITDGKEMGVTYDYTITGEKSFSRHREQWVWRHGGY